jgi:hypothetical protein
VSLIDDAFKRAGYQYEDTGGGFNAWVRYRPGLIVAVNDGESQVPRSWNEKTASCLFEPELESDGSVYWGGSQILCIDIRAKQLLATDDNSAAVLDAWNAEHRASHMTPAAVAEAAARFPLHVMALLSSGIPVQILPFQSGGFVLITYGRRALPFAEVLSHEGQRIGGAFWVFYAPA